MMEPKFYYRKNCQTIAKTVKQLQKLSNNCKNCQTMPNICKQETVPSAVGSPALTPGFLDGRHLPSPPPSSLSGRKPQHLYLYHSNICLVVHQPTRTGNSSVCDQKSRTSCSHIFSCISITAFIILQIAVFNEKHNQTLHSAVELHSAKHCLCWSDKLRRIFHKAGVHGYLSQDKVKTPKGFQLGVRTWRLLVLTFHCVHLNALQRTFKFSETDTHSQWSTENPY